MKTKSRLLKILAVVFVALFALACLVGLAACNSSSENSDAYSDSDNIVSDETTEETIVLQELTYELNSDDTYTVAGCENEPTSIVIPAEHDGLPVTIIGLRAFEGLTSVKSLTIGENITSIGGSAFANCTFLTEINYNATNVSNVSNSSSTNRVFQNAGVNGTGITVTIGANVTMIPARLFYPGNYSSDAPNITTVVFEKDSQCTSIGHYAFMYCSSLTSITLPESLTTIGSQAFCSCKGLTSITLPESLRDIGQNAFQASGLTDITLPYGMTTIGDYAFAQCSISNINIPDSVTSIGSYTFYFCSSLTQIVIPTSVKSIGSFAFYQSNLRTVFYAGTASQWNSISTGYYNSNLSSATKYYYSETQPTDSGNYWHYVDGVPTAW